MKKSRVGLLVLIMVLALAACSGGTAEESEPVEETGLNEAYSDALPIASQLALGSLQLEETELAIDEEQAANLLTLWQAFQSLSASDATAEVEMDAVVRQIQEGMSDEQIEAIAAMALTAEDITVYAEEVGLAMGRGVFGGGGEGDENNAPGGGIPRGGGVPGGGGEPGGGVPGGLGGDPAARETRLAEMGGDPEAMRARLTSQAMVGSLVRSMQIKTGEIDPSEEPLGFNRGLRTAGWVFDIVSESSGIPFETLQAETAEGASLSEVITGQGGDLEAVEAALAEALSAMPANANIDVEQRVSELLNQSWVAETE